MALHCLEAGLVPPEISPGAAHSMLRVCRALDAVHALARGSIRRLRAGRFLAALTLVVPFVCVSAASTLSPCPPRSARRLASPTLRKLLTSRLHVPVKLLTARAPRPAPSATIQWKPSRAVRSRATCALLNVLLAALTLHSCPTPHAFTLTRCMPHALG